MLFKRLRIPFESAAPMVDEQTFKCGDLTAKQMAEALSRMKAESLGAKFPESLIIGGDQVAEVDGRILEKPGRFERAKEQLELLSGRSHRLWTGLAVSDPSSGKMESFVEEHVMTMRPLTAEQIERYIALDQPLDCAGAYRIESLGISLFEEIRGNDFTAIVGLPLIRLVSMLRHFGVSLLDHKAYVDDDPAD
jgi:septum formation protein